MCDVAKSMEGEVDIAVTVDRNQCGGLRGSYFLLNFIKTTCIKFPETTGYFQRKLPRTSKTTPIQNNMIYTGAVIRKSAVLYTR